MVRNRTVYKFKCFAYLFPFSHKMDTNFKLISENMHFRCTSPTYLAIAAKRIDHFDI